MNDADAMRAALEVAARALGATRPNPSVGAVLVRDGQLLGRGHTQPPGGPHAEVMALADCRANGHDPAGATMVVTLEPCCHHGRTPPCTDAILAAGVRRVVVGVVDPFEPMRGRSLELLRQRGVEVELGVLADACADQMRGFLRVMSEGLPELTLKTAVSADGHIADAAGASRWITGPEARLDVHRLRAAHDAVLVGVGTVLADDPSLDARDVGAVAQPVPVVLDTNLRTPPTAKVLARSPVLVCAEDAVDPGLPAVVLRVPRGPGGVDVVAAARALAARGLHRVLVEGGGEVARSLLDAGLVDRVVVYMAGVVLPGGRPWVGGPPGALSAATRWGRPEVSVVGDDARLVWTLRAAPGGS